jgi:hypothetical protein
MGKRLHGKAEARKYRQEYSQRPHVKKANQERARRQRLKEYGLTEQAFADLLYEQNYRCAICRSPEWGIRGPQIDHNHITNEIRGLLCSKCNLALGMLGDDEDSILKVLHYFRRRNR